MSQEDAKKAAGTRAVDFIKDDMLIGIGTGSTVYYFIKELIHRCRQGLKIKAVFSSKASEKQALMGGVPCVDINQITTIDLTVDGADEIDHHFNMIKGGGGALFREKILASSSRDMIAIVDESKVVSKLGACKLPIEILPFGIQLTIYKINKLGFQGQIRKTKNNLDYITDNGNLIYDIDIRETKIKLRELHQNLIYIPGVIETGLFFDMAKKLIIGYQDGLIEERNMS